jgi:hypothetical protein
MVMRAAWPLLAVGAIGAGCASVLQIPDDSLSFCNQSANQGHDYCEDFDVGDPATRWTFQENLAGGTYSLQPSDRSPPNLIDLSVPGVPAGGSALAGFDKEFPQSPFDGIHIEADVRFVVPDGGALTANGGFLLITDKGGGCIGVGVGSPPGGAPGVGIVSFTDGGACSALTGSAGPQSGTPNQPLVNLPPPNAWYHIAVDVSPDLPTLPGKISFDFVGLPTGGQATLDLPAGTLPPTGHPLVGFAAEVRGPSGPLEVQYDNITIDLGPRQ